MVCYAQSWVRHIWHASGNMPVFVMMKKPVGVVLDFLISYCPATENSMAYSRWFKSLTMGVGGVQYAFIRRMFIFSSCVVILPKLFHSVVNNVGTVILTYPNLGS